MFQHINNLINGPSSSPLFRFECKCEPVSLTAGMVALSAASAAMQVKGQANAAKQYNSVQEAQRMETENVIEENRRRATQDYLTTTRLEREQQSQEQEAVAQKTNDLNREAARTIATGNASAAERGVAGRTVDQIAADFDFAANEETGRLKANQNLANQQHAENVLAAGTEFSNRAASIKPYIKTPARQIDYFGPIFQVGAQTLGTINAMPAGSLKGPGFGAASSSGNPLLPQ